MKTSIGPGFAMLMMPVLVALSCQGAQQAMRKVTYPPEFRYMERAQVDEAMGAMARAVVEMDRLLAQEPPPAAAVGEELKAIEFAARGVTGARASNHPLLSQRLDAFLEQVRSARTAVEHEPPSFQAAAAVTGACLACHGSPL